MSKAKLFLYTLTLTTIYTSFAGDVGIVNNFNNFIQTSGSILRDKNGHILGKINTKSDGTQEIRDKNGHYLGKYSPKTNITYDKNGHKIGSGNQLAALLIH